MTEFYCFVAAERPSCGNTKFYCVAIKFILRPSRGDIEFFSYPSYGDAEFYFTSVRRQHRILSRFGAAKYPPCGDAICLNLTRLAMHRSIRLNSERLLRAGIADNDCAF